MTTDALATTGLRKQSAQISRNALASGSHAFLWVNENRELTLGG
jgi:hypothetical protein